MWYSNSRLLSYNKVLSFVIGNRGGGKTYNATKWCINDYLKNGKQFVWVRRYKTELKKINQWFEAVKHEYPDHNFRVVGTTAYLVKTDDKGKESLYIMGYFIPLSVQQNFKSTSFPKVNKIIYDEFLIDKGNIRYLSNEVDSYLNLFETVARSRDDVRGVFLGNNISIVNPYFTYFNLKIDLSKQFNVFDSIVVEYYKSSEFIEMKKKTRFGKLVSGTEFGDFSIDNNSMRDKPQFIAKRTPNSKFEYAMKYNGVFYGVWSDYKTGKFFISKKYDKGSINNFALTTDDHDINLLYIREFKRSARVKTLVFAFSMGLIYYEDQECKNKFTEIYQLIK